MNLLEGLIHLFRFDTMGANWRSVLSSFDPITAGIILAAAPVVAPMIAQKLKDLGIVTEQKETERAVKTGLEAVGTVTTFIPA